MKRSKSMYKKWHFEKTEIKYFDKITDFDIL